MNQPVITKVAYTAGEAVERPWGRWRVLEVGSGFCIKKFEVEPGHRLSLQYHHHRYEDWIIVQGSGLVQCAEETFPVTAGDRVRIPLMAHHRISNHGQGTLIVVEVQHGSYLGEDDIVRVEDDYGR